MSRASNEGHRPEGRYGLIVVGVSAGGLSALCDLLRPLPENFPLAIAVVQHRSKDSTALASVLQDCTQLRVCDVDDKTPINPGEVHIAPPDYHILVDDGFYSLSVDEPVTYSRPSIDVLFESAADQLGSAVIGIVMTGANRDGSQGLRRIADRGGHAIVQDPQTAEVPVMPAAALALVPDAVVLPVDAMAAHLVQLVGPAHPQDGRASA